MDDEEAQQQKVAVKIDEFEIVSREEYVEMRGAKIAHVAQSLNTINTLYENINEIVQQQGITLNRIEGNVVSGKQNVSEAKKEMQKATKNTQTKSLIERLRQGETGMVSLMVCFVFVVILFWVDVRLVN